MVGTGCGGRGARRGGPRAGALGSGHQCRGARGTLCRAPAPAEFLRVQVVQPSPRPDGVGALVQLGGLVSVDIVVQGPSDGAPRPAVGGVIRGGAPRMDEGHPGGVNDVGGRIAVNTGSIAPHGFDALTGHTPPLEGLVPGWVRMPINGAGRSPYRAQVYTVYAAFLVSAIKSVRGRLCSAVGDEYL